MANEESEEQRKLSLKIARLFDEVWTSQAAHVRKLKELVSLHSSSPPAEFCEAFCRALTPLFNFQRRTASAERIIKFAAVFACSRGGKGNSGDEFLENFLKFLLVGAAAANKTVRFRACQIVSEIIMRLPDDAEVSNELWDEVIECMRLRVADKVPAVRTFAVRALARFANDSENGDVLELFLESATLPMIFDCTLDVNESVRKAAYSVLACKVPLQSLSIKHRTNILQRGLTDRSTAVAKDCVKLLKDEWLEKCCNGDPVELLKFLDVETYESVGELVMTTLLKAGLVKMQNGQTIRKFLISNVDSAEGTNAIHLDLHIWVFGNSLNLTK
ncbi:UNVERIFIED_CONTAM: Condensin complex subunit [Sesamum angustifolium]|uniref:Condensin complex subunit n=1 Tax=Sesamum angustifolium TaxID=2727405 RepID=A0AAW2RM41_9LAMI